MGNISPICRAAGIPVLDVEFFLLHFRMALILTDFQTAMSTVGNLSIMGTSMSKQEKFKCRSAYPNIKYNCAVYLSQLYWLFIYTSKYFLIDHHCKTIVKIFWFPRKGQIYWTPYRMHLSELNKYTQTCGGWSFTVHCTINDLDLLAIFVIFQND